MLVAVNLQRTLTRWVEPERPNLPIRRLGSIATDEPNFEKSRISVEKLVKTSGINPEVFLRASGSCYFEMDCMI
jgi:hypothetical protein